MWNKQDNDSLMQLQKEQMADDMSGGRVRLRLCWNMLWLGLFFIMAGIFLICAPKYADDIWYLNKMSQWLTERGVVSLDDACFTIFGEFPWQEVKDTLTWRYYNDNIRLGNVIGVFFLLLPKWIGSVLALIALIYSVKKVFSLVDVRWRSSSLVLVAIFVLSFVVPWYNSLGSIIYQFNYLLPTAIGLWLVGIVFNRDNEGSRFWVGFSVGLLLGLWHEGFGVPVMAGLVFMAIFRRHLRRKVLYGAVAGIAIGTVFLFTSPGMLDRGGSALDSMFSHRINLFHFVSSFSIFAVSTVVYVYLLSVSRNKNNKSDDIACMSVVSGIVSFMIQLFTDINCGRIGWWCHIMTLPVLLYVLDVTGHDFWKRYTWKNISLLILPATLSYLHMGTIDYLAVRMSDSYRHIESECNKGRTEVFADAMRLGELPLPVINTNMYDLYDISHFIGDYYTKSDTIYISIVSKDLENVTSLSGREVPGGSGVRDYNGNLYVEYDDTIRYGWEVYLQCDFGNGYVRTPFLCNSFISKADGCRYVELRPRVNVYKARYRKIEGIKPGIELP